MSDLTRQRPVFPRNLVLRDGEMPCRICGSGQGDHAGRDHAYDSDTPVFRLRRWICSFVAVLMLVLLSATSFSQDQYALAQAVFVNSPTDIGSYPTTAHITRVRFFPGRGWTVEFDRRLGASAWPEFITPGWDGPLQYTLGMCSIQKRTCSGVVEFWKTRLDEAPPNGGIGAGGDPGHIDRDWFYDPRWGELYGWQPAMGEQVAVFIVGGDARNQSQLPGGAIKQRTAAVVLNWGQDWDASTQPPPVEPPPPVVVPPGQPPVVIPPAQPPVDMSDIRTLLKLTATYEQSERIYFDTKSEFDALNKRLDQIEAEVNRPMWLIRGLDWARKNPLVMGLVASFGTYIEERIRKP